MGDGSIEGSGTTVVLGGCTCVGNGIGPCGDVVEDITAGVTGVGDDGDGNGVV